MRMWGLLAGLIVASILGSWFGWHEGVVLALGAVGGGIAAHVNRRINQLQSEVQTLQQQVATLSRRPSPTEVALERAADSAGSSAEPVERTPVPMPAPMPAAMPTMPAASAAATTPVPASSPVPAPTPAAAPLPPARPPQRAPSALEPDERSLAVTTSLGASVLAWFRGGNTIVRVGVLVLLVGVGLLLRYAAEHAFIPLPWRLAGAALGGLGLTVVGLRLTPRRRGYGLSLQGAGVGIAYMTLFAAFRLYGLMPSGLSFGLMALLCAAITTLALKQDALPLAVLGFGGAFLAPVLVSTGQGSHVALLSYYLLLNLAIAALARRKPWKLLHVEGFLFTLGIGSAWGMASYRPELFASTEPFLVAHFLLYLYIGVRYTLNLIERSTPAQGLPLIDGGLFFGTPIAAFGLQAALLRDRPLALAFSAAVMSGIYLLLGRALLRRAGDRVQLLVESMLAMGLIFLALVTPLALDARWTSAAWAVQGAGVLWIALRQQRRWAAIMGLLLQALACVAYWSGHGNALHTTGGSWLFLNSAWLGLALLLVALLFSGHALQRQPRENGIAKALAEPVMSSLLLGAALLQLWGAGIGELQHWDQSRYTDTMLVAVWGLVMAAGCEALRGRLRWPAMSVAGLLLAGEGLGVSVFQLVLALLSLEGTAAQYLLQDGGLDVAAFGLGLAAWVLRRHGSEELSEQARLALLPRLQRGLLVLALWHLLIHAGALLYALAATHIGRHEAWTPAALIVLPTLLALGLVSSRMDGRWPMQPHRDVLRRTVLKPWLAVLMLWSLGANLVGNGRMDPLPSLPLLNPLDLAHGLVLIYVLRLARSDPEGQLTPPWRTVGAGLAFFWLNSLLVRVLHQVAGTPLWPDGALGNALVHTSLSVLWTLTALVAMGWATRRAPAHLARPVWMLGAGLLAVVVGKLFLVDLSMLGSLQRIVSFLVVGLLMLVIGYIAPLPPAEGAASAKDRP